MFIALFDLMTYLICKLGDLIFKLGDGHYSMKFRLDMVHIILKFGDDSSSH